MGPDGARRLLKTFAPGGQHMMVINMTLIIVIVAWLIRDSELVEKFGQSPGGRAEYKLARRVSIR